MITFQDPHRPLQLLPWDGRPFRPQKANVNCQPCDETFQSVNWSLDGYSRRWSEFLQKPYWLLVVKFAVQIIGWYNIQFTSRPQIFQQLPEPLMGIWTALSPCEMVQGAFVWPQRWSNTAPHQTAGKGIPKLQEQQTHMQHTLVAIQRRSIKWLIKSENIILLE